ncbi:MAG: DUF935 family protein [Verrucomicrobiaceae bacterium]|nr:DUF935 family protein [Verrucomicrobiaceae bacterium]
MNSKNISQTSIKNLPRSVFNPIKNLRPEAVIRALDAFNNGRLSTGARMFESILTRDDTICCLNLKRKKSVSRLDVEIVPLENSRRARAHQKALTKFYETLTVSSVIDKNISGGIRMLISQMMNCVAMKYAIHKIKFSQDGENIKGVFTEYPLWLFENTSGKLRILKNENQLTDGYDLDDAKWLITCGDGLMQASAIAYVFKHLPLRDWLIYCERNGMPGIKAKTNAFPNSPQWESAKDAVSQFGAEFYAVLSEGTDIEAIDVSSKNQLPYQSIIERMDRMLCALWRGADLGTISGSNKLGASMQWYESTLIEEDDAVNISENLNRNVDTKVIKLLFGDNQPLAKFRLKLPDYEEKKYELDVIERLSKLGLEPDKLELAKKFAFPLKTEVSQNENQ